VQEAAGPDFAGGNSVFKAQMKICPQNETAKGGRLRAAPVDFRHEVGTGAGAQVFRKVLLIHPVPRGPGRGPALDVAWQRSRLRPGFDELRNMSPQAGHAAGQRLSAVAGGGWPANLGQEEWFQLARRRPKMIGRSARSGEIRPRPVRSITHEGGCGEAPDGESRCGAEQARSTTAGSPTTAGGPSALTAGTFLLDWRASRSRKRGRDERAGWGAAPAERRRMLARPPAAPICLAAGADAGHGLAEGSPAAAASRHGKSRVNVQQEVSRTGTRPARIERARPGLAVSATALTPGGPDHGAPRPKHAPADPFASSRWSTPAGAMPGERRAFRRHLHGPGGCNCRRAFPESLSGRKGPRQHAARRRPAGMTRGAGRIENGRNSPDRGCGAPHRPGCGHFPPRWGPAPTMNEGW